MINHREAPKTLATPLATRLSAALLSLFVCFVFIYFHILHGRNFKVHTRWTHGIPVSDLHGGRQVSRGD
jgi:hypothetical protein